MDGAEARQFLRAETGQAHAVLDDHPVAQRLVAGQPLARPAYALILSGYHAWFQAWESGFVQAHPDLVATVGPERFEKSSLLALDLAELPARSFGPLLHPPPIPQTAAAAAGALYVVEGSTLGGRQILQRLVLDPPRRAHEKARFFEGYGSETGPRWQALMTWIEEILPEDGRCRSEAADSATRTFRSFAQLFEQLEEELRPAATPPP